jgi:hypothetical protein
MGEEGLLKGIVDSEGVCKRSPDTSNRISI